MVEDVAAIAAVLKNSLRVMIFMATMILRSPAQNQSICPGLESLGSWNLMETPAGSSAI